MSSSITLYDDAGNPVVIDGEAIKQGLATAWVSFDGTDGSINGSYNVSSVVRQSNGTYTINFTTPMDNTNYSIGGMSNGASGVAYAAVVTPSTITTTSFNIVTYIELTPASSGPKVSGTLVMLQIFGGKN